MLLKSRGKTVSTSFHAVFKYVPVNASNSQQKSDQLLAKNGSRKQSEEYVAQKIQYHGQIIQGIAQRSRQKDQTGGFGG